MLHHEPPFTKARCGPHYKWAAELELLYDFAKREKLKLELVTAEYQVAKLSGTDVRILIYPHRTQGTGNRHLRVRDEHSVNPDRADDLMLDLDELVPGYCTFTRNTGGDNFRRIQAAKARRVRRAA